MANFGDETSVHGLKYILLPKYHKLLRIFWSLALFASFCGFSFYFYSAFVKWQINPEIVVVARERSSSEFPGPAVTICISLFAKNNSAKFHESLIIFRNNLQANFSDEECEVLAANLHWCQPNLGQLAQGLCEGFDVDSVSVLENIEKSALEVDEAFYLCVNGSCDKEIFPIFTNFGMCYTTNMMTSSQIFTDEIHEDFKKIKTLFSNETEPLWTPEKGYRDENVTFPVRAKQFDVGFQPVLSEVDRENVCAGDNFLIFIHKPNEIPTPSHHTIHLNYDEYMTVYVTPTSHRTDEALRGFSPEIRKCYFEGEMKLKFFKTYTKALCEWECKVNLTLQSCGCVEFSMLRDQKTKVCNLKELQCTLTVGDSFDEVSCNCYPSCSDIKYNYRMDRSNLAKKRLPDFPNSSTLSWVQFEIEIKVVEEVEKFLSYKVMNFISDFGGLLGLFMGCSLLSIIEIFCFTFKSFIGIFMKRETSPENQKWAKTVKPKFSLENYNQEMIQINEILDQLTTQISDLQKSLDQQAQTTQKLFNNV